MAMIDSVTQKPLQSIKIAVGQIAPRVGSLQHNFQQIHDFYVQNKSANIVVLPELATCGYLAQDLLHKPDFINDIHVNIQRLIEATSDTTLLLPTPYLIEGNLYNSVLAIKNREIIGITHKRELPNYGIFDEKRYFTPGIPQTIDIDGLKVGIPICEDIWHKDVCSDLKKQGAEIFIIPNGSPFEQGKHNKRIEIIKQRFLDTKIPLLYCNQVLGHDGIVFDGKSFCYDGTLHQFGLAFKPSNSVVTLAGKKFKTSELSVTNSPAADIYEAMKLGLRDYVIQNGFSKVIIGISGGIDSALVACICADSLGAKNVTGYMLPSKFSSEESKLDALGLADNLGITLEEINISAAVEQIITGISTTAEDKKSANNFDWQNADLTIQNLQSRIRGCILMAKSNSDNALLITTGNKSEYATGYATLYGDMNGAFNPVKDLYKTEIYDIANYRNNIKADIPQNIIDKEPTAELSPNQKDSDNLPEYYLLDQILFSYIEDDLSQKQLKQKFPDDIVEKIINLVNIAEYKRFQSAPGVKISSREFGRDRRYPLTNEYK